MTPDLVRRRPWNMSAGAVPCRSLQLVAAAMLACLVVLGPAATPAIAATDIASQRDYAIPPGKLSDVLAQFAAASGIPLAFDPQPLAAIASPGVQGRLSAREGFDRLLAGSGYELIEMAGGYSIRKLPTPAGVSQLSGVTATATLYGAKETSALGDTASSVGLVTAQDIANGQIRSFRESFRRLGNVMDGDWTDAGFIIRGLSSEGFTSGGAPLASFYVDGVLQTPNGTRRGARGLWDVEQVEVYRGPQSTFSGKAAMAGAIYVKTKDPTFTQEAQLSATGASDSLANGAFMLNQPIDDQIAVRVAGEFERSKSDLEYPTYERFDRYDEFTTDLYYNLRGKVLLAPRAMESSKALISYSFAHDAPTPRDVARGASFSLKDDRGDFNIPTYTEVRQTNVSNLGIEATHDISDSLRFTSLTGGTMSLTRRPSVNEGTQGEINVVKGDQEDLIGTQEFRLNYDARPLRWVAGAYASYQQLDTTFDRTLSALRNDTQYLERNTSNFAGFGEVTYEFVPSYKITVGGRLDYTRQLSKQVNYRRQPLTVSPALLSAYSAEITELNFVPKIGFSKDFGDRHVLGATYTEGFRTGGYGFNSSTLKAYSFDPERAKNHELYYKGRFFEDRLLLNANVFYTKYTDQQVEMRLDPSDPFYREIVNAASSRSWGFEIEPTIRVIDGLSAFASIGYVNTKFIDFNDSNYGDLSGSAFPEAPRWSVAFGAHYDFADGFFVGGDAKFTSNYLARLGSPPQDRLSARTIVNTQVGYRADNWEVMAFAENLLDKRYLTYLDSAGGLEYATLGPDRRVGVNVKMRF